MKNILSCIFVLLTLISCTSTRNQANNKKSQVPLAETFAYERAASIAQVVPMKIGNFILNKASSDKANVYLSLQVAKNQQINSNYVTNELNNISKGFCRDKKISLVIAQGVSYYLTVKAMNNSIATAVVNMQSCENMSFINVLSSITD